MIATETLVNRAFFGEVDLKPGHCALFTVGDNYTIEISQISKSRFLKKSKNPVDQFRITLNSLSTYNIMSRTGRPRKDFDSMKDEIKEWFLIDSILLTSLCAYVREYLGLEIDSRTMESRLRK